MPSTSRPLVSIVIPTFNRLRFLGEALDSVAAQTLRDFEVIVVDDGSTEPVAEAVAGHPTKPRVIRQPRQGPGAARNRGIAEASADIIAFLDSDDLWQPTKLDRFISAFGAYPDTSIFYGPMQPILATGEPVAGRTKPCHAGWITEALFCSSFVHVPTVVCRRELLTREGGFDPALPVCEDYNLWLRMSVKESFGLVDEPLALRRLHPDRLSKSCMSRNLAVKARVLRRFYESGAAQNRLDPEVAAARLARVCQAAGRAALRAADFPQAVEFCRESRRYGGRSLQNAATLWTAAVLERFKGNGREPATAPPLLTRAPCTFARPEQNELTDLDRSPPGTPPATAPASPAELVKHNA